MNFWINEIIISVYADRCGTRLFLKKMLYNKEYGRRDYMKIAAIYTGIGPSLMSVVNKELSLQVPGHNIMTFADPSLLDEIIDNGYITVKVRRKLLGMYFNAVNCGAEIIYNICSSVGEIADEAKHIFSLMDVSVVRIDELMAVNAVKTGNTLGVIATLPSTLNPTKCLLNKTAQNHNLNINIIDALIDDGYHLPQQEMNKAIIEKAIKIAPSVDAVVLAQASMALCEEELRAKCDKPVFSSPRFGALNIKNVVNNINKEKKYEF